ncbi:MAG TPA: alkaline phosphatase family protein [Ruminiclostridium sp.]|nr:alkaline phosphatase family protein [Ruminiclostridium sp.]
MAGQRTFILGLDGMPYTLLQDMFLKNRMKNLKNISERGAVKRFNSVIPTISSVAWTSYATGENPAEHNIYGFVDRTANPFSIKIPTSRDRRAETVWSKLSEEGKRVISINVPMTYPPEKINGIMVSCFLCTDIKKATYPPGFYKFLEERQYVIDIDAWLVRKSKKAYLEELVNILEKRFEVAFEIMDQEMWDFFQLHIMETDRLMHFFWDVISGGGSSEYYCLVDKFFERLDFFIGKLVNKLSKEDRIIILSDHGFCGIKKEVQMNNWLESEGLLKFDYPDKRQLTDFLPESAAYSLLPGRIFINLEGREEKGSVPVSRYREFVEDISERLTKLRNPENGENVIEKVFLRDNIYAGRYIDNSPDIIAHPKDGYDLKGALDSRDIFTNSILNGMHTYDDAMLIGVNCDISKINSIDQVAEVLLQSR